MDVDGLTERACLWAVLVLARLYDVDLETEFTRTMDDLETSLRRQPD
jgi:NTP pyrophosphatase (non-canonical NTP hydrolase)